MLKELNISYKQTAAGDKVRASGALIIAEDTGNILLIFRSSKCADPNVWCGVGGKIEEGESTEEACRREIEEEIGYLQTAPMVLRPIFLFENDTLEFHNHIGVVPNEFYPKLNWESAGYVWCRLDCLPSPQHYGLQAILNDPYSQGMLVALSANAEQVTEDLIEVEANMHRPGRWGSRSPTSL